MGSGSVLLFVVRIYLCSQKLEFFVVNGAAAVILIAVSDPVVVSSEISTLSSKNHNLMGGTTRNNAKGGTVWFDSICTTSKNYFCLLWFCIWFGVCLSEWE